jgi:hypothetical protein
MTNGFDWRPVLQTNRGEYRGITSDGFDRASTASGYVDEDLRQPTGFIEAQSGSVAMASMFEIEQFVRSSLRKSPSQLH